MFRQLCVSFLLFSLSASWVIAQPIDEPPVANSNDNQAEGVEEAESEEPPVYTIIEGQVVNALGEGIVGASVAIVKVDDNSIQGKTESVEYGDFKIKFEGEHVGKFKVTLGKENYASEEIEIEVYEDDLEPFVDLMLDGALTLAGEVVEFLENQPVAGAQVKISTSYRTKRVTTDEAGRFEIKKLMPGEARIVVEADGFGKNTTRVPVGMSKDLVRIILKPERILRLTILDDQDRPIADVSVEIEVKSSGDYRTVSTDEEGQVTIRKLAGDACLMWARLTHSDYVATGQYDREITLPQDEYETKQTLHMMPAAVLKGLVLNAESGRPLHGARVGVGVRMGEAMPHTYTNLSGEYELRSLLPGSSVVTVHVAEYAPLLKELKLEAGETTVENFELGRGRTIVGVVSNQDGQPVAGADVDALKWKTYSTLALYARTDQNGKFILESAPPEEFLIDIVSRSEGALVEQVISAGKNNYEFKLDSSKGPLAQGRDQFTTAKPGDVYPGIRLVTLEGLTLGQEQFEGKLVLLDFWATWCGPCVQEVPTLKRIHQTFGGREDFLLVGVSSDYEKSKLTSFIRTNQMKWHHVFGASSGSEELRRAFGVQAIPSTILLGADGKIISVDLVGEALHNKITEIFKTK